MLSEIELLSTWHINIETQNKLTTDDKKLLMNLSPAYMQWREETLQEGRFETQRVFVKSWLIFRFGKIDRVLSRVVEPLVQLPPEKSARLLPRLSRDELLAKFGKKS